MSAGLWTAKELRVGWESGPPGRRVVPGAAPAGSTFTVSQAAGLRALFHCLKVKSGRHGIHPPF